jgi:FMN phosphatase YigB (HAD superfamily)/2-polyprenyl-3-methyl-5-hydroxy-6-metoxy-1,4-benzoquinol methylase
MISSVIFDFAGTIAEKHPKDQDIWDSYLKNIGIHVPKTNIIKAIKIVQHKNLYKSVKIKTKDERKKFYTDFNRDVLKALGIYHLDKDLPGKVHKKFTLVDREWILKDGVADLFKKIKKSNRKIGILSNFDMSLREVLKNNNILSEVDFLMVSAEEGIEKPDTEIYKKFFENFNLNFDSALYVGDNYELDIIPAVSCGIKTILIDESGLFHNQKDVIRNINEVEYFLNGLEYSERQVSNKVKLTKFGHYELLSKPDKEELKSYYEKEYFQNECAQYSHQYSADEIEFFENAIKANYRALVDIATITDNPKFLEVGCGEGFALKIFKDLGWDITGLDFSNFGCESQNPDCVESLILGDIHDSIEILIKHNKKYDIIYVDHILEHLIDPLAFLNRIRHLIEDDGAMFIGVPNDFSSLQAHLKNKGYITNDFWIKYPEHISYFSSKSIENLCKSSGWSVVDFSGTFPIDLNLFNQDTNYINFPEKGPECHRARVEIDNFFNAKSEDLTRDYYRILGKMGLGRDINFYLKFTGEEL